MAVREDQGRSVVLGQRRVERPSDRLDVVDVGHCCHVPAVRDKARRHVLCEGDVGVALDRHTVRVVDQTQVGELQVRSQRRRLRRDPLHHAAVSGEGVDVEVEEREPFSVVPGCEPPAGDGHADGGRNPLAQWTGGCLDAARPSVLGVPGAPGVELAEGFEVIERHRGSAQHLVVRVDGPDAGQVEERPEQGRRMPFGEDEPVTIRPDRVVRIEAQVALPEGVRHRRHPHGCAGVTRVRLLHGVHAQRPDRIDGELVEVGVLGGRHRFSSSLRVQRSGNFRRRTAHRRSAVGSAPCERFVI